MNDTHVSERPAHPIKFAHTNVGYVLDELETATVRYQFEHQVSEGDFLNIQTPNGNYVDTAVVTDVIRCPVRHAFFELKSIGAEHPSTGTFNLLERLNEHYDDEITLEDQVEIFAFSFLGET